ncbi:MAG: hypothetical protein LRS46_02370 [Desulfurococcales archaeon]|nr:hypothetical protein [Desulfurococcales archaeon]
MKFRRAVRALPEELASELAAEYERMIDEALSLRALWLSQTLSITRRWRGGRK